MQEISIKCKKFFHPEDCQNWSRSIREVVRFTSLETENSELGMILSSLPQLSMLEQMLGPQTS